MCTHLCTYFKQTTSLNAIFFDILKWTKDEEMLIQLNSFLQPFSVCLLVSSWKSECTLRARKKICTESQVFVFNSHLKKELLFFFFFFNPGVLWPPPMHAFLVWFALTQTFASLLPALRLLLIEQPIVLMA